MSDTKDTKDKSKGGSGAQSWSDHELLVYLLSAIEYTGQKIDFANAPAPLGRNASGCAQKMGKLKKALQSEIDAVKNGETINRPGSATAMTKKGGGRKRKAKDDYDGTSENRGAKNRGRPKKKVESEPEEEPFIKDEPKREAEF